MKIYVIVVYHNTKERDNEVTTYGSIKAMLQDWPRLSYYTISKQLADNGRYQFGNVEIVKTELKRSTRDEA